MDSPRGRIYLMKAGVEGRAGLTPSLVTAHRQLPRLPGLRDRVPVGRAIRSADRTDPRPDRTAVSAAGRGPRVPRPVDGAGAVSRAHALGAGAAGGGRRPAPEPGAAVAGRATRQPLAAPRGDGGTGAAGHVRRHAPAGRGGHAGGGQRAWPGGAADRLRAAPVVRARQPGHRARAGRRRVPRRGARRRRGAAARCRCTRATSSRRGSWPATTSRCSNAWAWTASP